jgi:hypothetical protein
MFPAMDELHKMMDPQQWIGEIEVTFCMYHILSLELHTPHTVTGTTAPLQIVNVATHIPGRHEHKHQAQI